jgi:hypothetical protein
VTRPVPKSGADRLMELELLISSLQWSQRTGIPLDPDALKAQALESMRESGRAAAWRILDRSRDRLVCLRLEEQF